MTPGQWSGGHLLCTESEYAACRQIATGVVALAEAGDNNATAAGGVDKLAAADINTHMAGSGTGVVGAKEEHQIAGLQIAHGNFIAVVQLRCCAMGQTDAKIGKYVHRETGAVKSAVAGAAVSIGNTKILLGESNNVAAAAAEKQL